ncbi:helix-turn-helix domain-containing protein [Pseudonocardia alaniniphila]
MRDWRTIAEVADIFGVTVQTVHHWIRRNHLQADQAKRGTWLVHDSAIERFIAHRHAANTQPSARAGKTSSRPSVRIDPSKRYRLKGTGEIVTGAELLSRRTEA